MNWPLRDGNDPIGKTQHGKKDCVGCRTEGNSPDRDFNHSGLTRLRYASPPGDKGEGCPRPFFRPGRGWKRVRFWRRRGRRGEIARVSGGALPCR
jgi:hypothetical protein